VKVAYLFDLRVHEAYQRRGIGSRLSKIAEELVKSVGATLMYLTVNGDNQKARALYHKLGYETASRRRPGVALLRAVPTADPALPFEQVHDVQRARQLIADAFDLVDNTPLDLDAILASPSYEGTLYARSGSDEEASEAGVSLWNASRCSSIEFQQVILPAWVWR
jgi:Acetyltransferase (GNAT) family